MVANEAIGVTQRLEEHIRDKIKKQCTSADANSACIATCSTQKDESAVEDSDPKGFIVVGDNLDIRNKTRQQTRVHGNVDHHFFHLIAIKKINGPEQHSSSIPKSQKMKSDQLPPSTSFLPSVGDNDKLIEEFKYLIDKILSQYVPELEWMKEVTPPHIWHSNMQHVKGKTSSV